MRRIMMIILSAILAMGMMAGCANDAPETTAPEKVENENFVPETTELLTEEETEQPTEKEQMGNISLKNVQAWYESDMHPNIYIAYEDGSLDLYLGRGEYKNVSYNYGAFDGMYLENTLLERLPTIDDDVTLALFCNDNFYIDAYPVYSVVNVIPYGVDGYGMLDKVTGGYSLSVFYPGNDKYERYSLSTIDDKPTEDYEAVVHKGRKLVHYGFQDTDYVTIGVVEGTKVVEKKYSVSAKYYDCDPRQKAEDAEKSYDVKWTPTVEGYAKLDFTEVPEGQYVLYLEYAYKGKAYIKVYLATIEH